MIEVMTKKGQKLIAEKLHIDTTGEESCWVWCFDRKGNCIKDNPEDAICEIPESFTINGVKFIRAE